MEMFHKFSIRGAQLVHSFLHSVLTNPQAKQITLSFRATANDRAEMRVFLTEDEARDLQVKLAESLKGLGAASKTSTPLTTEHALWACKQPWFFQASRMAGDCYCIKARVTGDQLSRQFHSLESLEAYVGEQYEREV